MTRQTHFDVGDTVFTQQGVRCKVLATDENVLWVKNIDSEVYGFPEVSADHSSDYLQASDDFFTALLSPKEKAVQRYVHGRLNLGHVAAKKLSELKLFDMSRFNDDGSLKDLEKNK